uniref:Uncharacterized protein n=1 Tax=Acanthochromis polyacanthus TaxID=80966 RepID=A0A3Q1F1N7_9TELE
TGTQPTNDVSADSSAEFPDRVSMMEVRLQAQEDEITLLKSSLADALHTEIYKQQGIAKRKRVLVKQTIMLATIV